MTHTQIHTHLSSCYHLIKTPRVLGAAGKAGGVLLTTYGMCLHNADALARPARTASSLFRRDGAEEEEGAFRWDMVILDEGHKVRIGDACVFVEEMVQNGICAWVGVRHVWLWEYISVHFFGLTITSGVSLDIKPLSFQTFLCWSVCMVLREAQGHV
eukprot:scaffold87690_cov24-Tisochrysis_lutea.AAC.1